MAVPVLREAPVTSAHAPALPKQHGQKPAGSGSAQAEGGHRAGPDDRHRQPLEGAVLWVFDISEAMLDLSPLGALFERFADSPGARREWFELLIPQRAGGRRSR